MSLRFLGDQGIYIIIFFPGVFYVFKGYLGLRHLFFDFLCFGYLYVFRVTRAVNVMASGINIMINRREGMDALFLRSS